MSLFRSAARNVSIVAGSHALMWIATLLFTVVQARLLGPARFGELSLALSYALFLTVVIDFGLGIQLGRMVAQRRAGAEALGATVLLRTALWAIATPLLMLVTVALGYDAELRLVILVLALSVLLVGVNTSIEAYLRGNERFLLPSLASVAYRVTAAVVGIALLLLGSPLVLVAAAFLVGAAANLAVLLAGLRSLPPGTRWIDARLAARLFRAAIPLGLWWSIAAFAFGTDMAIMELRAPAENVGWYAAAYRLFNVATIFPAITVGMVLSPVLSRLSLGPREELRAVLEKSLAVLMLAGIAVCLVLVVFADGVIHLLYPAESYGAAANVLRLLAPRVLFLYVNSALLYTLIALHQERRLLLMAITFAILNPLANLVAIPLWRED
ncbi:MAG TPA: oligosaccharide flippase family protein, partial [Candidatus Limnocylindria bacterium]|nr:oligosaccharide flippase family protein [Candidatus Limnocylindria bacterium]